jgi:hypothetical protein
LSRRRTSVAKLRLWVPETRSCFAVLRALVLGLPVVTTRRRRVVRGSWRVKRKASTVLISPW